LPVWTWWHLRSTGKPAKRIAHSRMTTGSRQNSEVGGQTTHMKSEVKKNVSLTVKSSF
jgi:hypothetical protein